MDFSASTCIMQDLNNFHRKKYMIVILFLNMNFITTFQKEQVNKTITHFPLKKDIVYLQTLT